MYTTCVTDSLPSSFVLGWYLEIPELFDAFAAIPGVARAQEAFAFFCGVAQA